MYALRSNLVNGYRPVASQPMRRKLQVSAAADKAEMIKSTVANNKVVVFSKTYCPYCSNVKSLFKKLQVDAKVIELDTMGSEGAEIQQSLQSLTGSRTVPQVFVGSKFVGGCDDTYAAYNSGKLQTVFKEAGINIAA